MRALLFLIVFCLSGVAMAQDPVIQLRAGIRDDGTGKKLPGVTVEVLADGKPFVTKTSASNGKVPIIDLPLGPVYTIKVKKAGYVTKIARIDAHYDMPEELPLFLEQPFETSLFKEVEGVDFNFLETTPMIEFSFNSYGEVTWDRAKLKVMKKKIEDLKAEMEEKKKEQELAEQAAAQLEVDFSAYVSAGDAAMKKEDFETAISQYQAALDLKDDATVKSKLEDAKKKWEDQKANAAAEKAFSDKMAAAKREFDSKNLEPALKLYEEALKLKPSSELAQNRITEIKKMISDAAKAEEDFKKYVQEGDVAMSSELFDDAISKYEAALQIKPKDNGVQQKLADAKKKKAEKEQADADAKAQKEKFDKLLAEADKLFDTKDYEASKSKYEEAAAVIPDEAKPAQRIKEIDEILRKLKEESDAADKLEADYKKLISEGDVAFKAKNWDKAKDQYNAAIALKPGEEYPKNQLDLINKELEKEAANAKKLEEYNAHMSEAQNLFNQKKYKEARSKYEAALAIMPTEVEPKAKISEIDKILADLDKAAELEKKYNDLMTEGNALQANNDLVGALDKFKKALDVKAADQPATQKINEINKLIEEQNAAAEKDELFNKYVAKGVEAFNAKNYSEAKLNYEQALAVKDDADVKSKLKEIDDLIAAEKADADLKAKYDAAVKEADDFYAARNYDEALVKYEAALAIMETAHVKSRISDCKQQLNDMASAAEKEKKFNELVDAGNAAFGSENYTEALDKYKQALAIKPDPTISNKIKETNGLIAEKSANAELMKKYLAKIEEADAAFNTDNLNGAKELYAEAVNIKGDEEYPKQQLDKIDQMMKDEAAAETEKNYQKIITKANTLRDEERLDEAISYYERALSLKPSDEYPKEQIASIKQLKIDRAKAAADKDQLEKDYAAFIKTADEAYNAQNWSKALDSYKNALAIKPDEAHPKSRIDEVTAKMGDAEAYRLKKEEYDKYIAEADAAFRDENFQGAIPIYEKALTVLPDEQYPRDQIQKAEDIMRTASESEIEREYQKILTVAKRKFDQADYQKSLEYYQRAKDLRPSDPIPQQRIDEINQILSDLANSEKNRKEYESLIQKADSHFEKGEWGEAKKFYTQAYNLINERYPESQIALCEQYMKKNTVDEEARQYNKIIAAADKKFNAKNYLKAKDLYSRALKIKPTDPYPKQKLDEIDKILNPDKHVASSGGMKNYGQPNRNTNSVDVEGLLLEAEEQRRWISNKKAQQQREDAEELTVMHSQLQENHSFDTKDEVEEINVDLETKEWSAEVKRTEAEVVVDDLEEQMAGTYGDWDRGDDDNAELHRQVVQNIYIDVERDRAGMDVDRIEFVGDVEVIKLEVRDEEGVFRRSQTDDIMAQKREVERIEDEYVINDPNNDINRKNTEVHVEDLDVELINRNNESAWDQEDEVMNVKDMTELLIDERHAEGVNDDIPRLDNVETLKDMTDDNVRVEVVRGNEQEDITIEMKDYTEDMVTEMEIENMNNDLPRQNMELVVEEKDLEVEDRRKEKNEDQYNSVMDDKTSITNIEIAIEENKSDMDENREGYEMVVTEINEEILDKDTEIENRSTDESHETVNYLDNMEKDMDAIDELAILKAEKNTDNTVEMAEDIIEKNSEISKDTDEHLANNEDYVESLKDINPNEIDEKMKNSLGQQFPEGVTEEIYTLNDEDGLTVSVIVRRVVVRNGVGNFYEKAQSRFGTVTYTMNGQGITEFQWQNDTEAAELVRN